MAVLGDIGKSSAGGPSAAASTDGIGRLLAAPPAPFPVVPQPHDSGVAPPQRAPHTVSRLRLAAIVGLISAVVACGGGGGSSDSSGSSPTAGPTPSPTPAPTPSPTPPPAPPPAPSPSAFVAITLQLNAPAANRPGDVWLRAGASAFTRTDMRPNVDPVCSAAGPGNKSCTINVPRGQTVTLVANDSGAEVQFGSIAFNQRNADPRGPRSEFDGFGAPCTVTPSRGVCVLTANADQTVEVNYVALKWTRINFIGVVNWRFTALAPPTLGLNNNTDNQVVIVTPATPSVAECATSTVGVPCYDFISSRRASFRFESLPPIGPTPLGSSGPLRFIGFDNNCGSSSACDIFGGTENEVITMKWQYYLCNTGPSNPRWNYGPTLNDPARTTDPCPLVTPG